MASLAMLPLAVLPATPASAQPEPAQQPSEVKLTASDGVAGDGFSRAVAISGDTAVVGADLADPDGAAYVFVHTGGGWAEQARLTPPDPAQFEQFGISVAISGDTALIGTAQPFAGGAAYVFVRTGTTWTHQATLTVNQDPDLFGIRVALDGDTALVGAREADIAGNTNQGAAYVFVRTGTSWSQQAVLTASDGEAFDVFGDRLALDGDTAVVTAWVADRDGLPNVGRAWVFVRDAGQWSEQATLAASDAMAEDRFGFAVDVEGDTALVGAINVAGGQGAAYAFTRTGAAWSEQAILTASDGAPFEEFGSAAAIEGGTLAVGARFADNQGAAYVFTPSGGGWAEQLRIAASDGAAGDQFGGTAAFDGDTLLVGAPTATVGGSFGQGAAYGYEPVP